MAYRYEQIEDDKKLTAEQNEAIRHACMVEMFKAGEALPRTKFEALAPEVMTGEGWWDSFGPIEQPGEIATTASALKPGEIMRIERAVVPQPVWDRHSAKRNDPSRHGLTLSAEPCAIIVFKTPDNGLGLMIGYDAQ